ncbi:phosphate transporter [Phaffia rhodozyma]|uniref:Phosphate transporter n=1 Tax=Phaffia rhodozyma TaxID=264483 RepID=A0A0F7SWZ6_PHARH|nr:phosphate transporter [Phaffia rhodozyma]
MSTDIEYTSDAHKESKLGSDYQSPEMKRLAALRELDEASFSWFHVKTCIVAGVGFFTDAYDIFAINMASAMIGYVYGHNHALTANQDLGIKVATPCGTLIGQLLFGYLADRVGRKKMYGVELMIIIIATLGQAIAGSGPSSHVIGVIIFWRFIMGLGIGGDYPLSATISSEFASTKIRGRMMTAVFAAQGFGNFAAALVSFIVVSAYKKQILNDSTTEYYHIDVCWRLLIGLGCVPGVIALYYRLTISESPRYTVDVERDVAKAAQDAHTSVTTGTYYNDPDAVVERVEVPKASRRDFIRHNSKWSNLKILLGCAWSWFALDVAFYGLGLNSSIILTTIGYGGAAPKGSTPQFGAWKKLHDNAIGNMILSAGGLIPGYWFTFAFIDFWGRKPIQLMGFVLLTIIFCILGFGYDALLKTASGSKAFIFFYCMANFFQNFGPNTTTFVIPGEAFPTRYRATSHGISAASGKLGAIVAQVGFSRLKDIGGTGKFVKHIMELFAFFMLTGIFSTLLIPETMGRSLEDISNESDEDYVNSSSHDH